MPSMEGDPAVPALAAWVKEAASLPCCISSWWQHRAIGRLRWGALRSPLAPWYSPWGQSLQGLPQRVYVVLVSNFLMLQANCQNKLSGERPSRRIFLMSWWKTVRPVRAFTWARRHHSCTILIRIRTCPSPKVNGLFCCVLEGIQFRKHHVFSQDCNSHFAACPEFLLPKTCTKNYLHQKLRYKT